MPRSTKNLKRAKFDPKHMEKAVRAVLNKLEFVGRYVPWYMYHYSLTKKVICGYIPWYVASCTTEQKKVIFKNFLKI